MENNDLNFSYVRYGTPWNNLARCFNVLASKQFVATWCNVLTVLISIIVAFESFFFLIHLQNACEFEIPQKMSHLALFHKRPLFFFHFIQAPNNHPFVR